MKPPSIIIIEKESETRDLLMLAFESRGYMTWTCSALDTAIELFLTAQPDVVLMDWDGNEEHSLNFLQAWKRAAPRTQVIVQTDHTDETRREDVLSHGAHAYLMKPVTPEVLFEALNDRELVFSKTKQLA